MRPIIKSATSVLTVFSMALGIVLLIPNASAAAENGNWKADGSTKTSTGQKTPIEFIYKGSSSEAPSQTQARVNWGDETESGEDQEDNNTVSANSCTTTLGSKKFICEASGSHIYYQPGTYIGTLTPLAYNHETETSQPAGPPTTFKVTVTGNPIPRPYRLLSPRDVTSTVSPIPDMVTAPTEFACHQPVSMGFRLAQRPLTALKKMAQVHGRSLITQRLSDVQQEADGGVQGWSFLFSVTGERQSSNLTRDHYLVWGDRGLFP